MLDVVIKSPAFTIPFSSVTFTGTLPAKAIAGFIVLFWKNELPIAIILLPSITIAGWVLTMPAMLVSYCLADFLALPSFSKSVVANTKHLNNSVNLLYLLNARGE